MGSSPATTPQPQSSTYPGPLPPPPPYPAPPPAAPAYGAPPAEYTPLFKPSTAPYPALVKNSILVIAVVTSVLMLFLGAMLTHYAPQIYNKEYSDDPAGEDQREDDQRTAVAVMNTGRILADVGAFLLLLELLLAGLLRNDWSDYVRFGVLFFVAVFAFSLGFRL